MEARKPRLRGRQTQRVCYHFCLLALNIQPKVQESSGETPIVSSDIIKEVQLFHHLGREKVDSSNLPHEFSAHKCLYAHRAGEFEF